jgi:hypothetical protein
MRHHISSHYRKLLFLKSEDWSAEREYRWVYLAAPDREEILVPIDDALRGVFVGFQVGRVVGNPYTPGIRDVCRSAPVFEMVWEWGHFQRPVTA